MGRKAIRYISHSICLLPVTNNFNQQLAGVGSRCILFAAMLFAWKMLVEKRHFLSVVGRRKNFQIALRTTQHNAISFGKRLNLIWATVALVLCRHSPVHFCFVLVAVVPLSDHNERGVRGFCLLLLVQWSKQQKSSWETTKFFMGICL